MCIDYRAINVRKKRDAFPLHRIWEVFDLLGEAKIFSTLALAQGHHQMTMQPGDIEKTAFSTFDAHYKYTKLPFGLVNAPASFQRFMHTTMEEFIPDIMLV